MHHGMKKNLSQKINDIISQADELLEDLDSIEELSASSSKSESIQQATETASATPEPDGYLFSELTAGRKAKIFDDNRGNQNAWIPLGIILSLVCLISVAVNLINGSDFNPPWRQAPKEQVERDKAENRKKQRKPEGLQPNLEPQFDAFKLVEIEPSNDQVQELLQAWLDRKTFVLAGGSVHASRLEDVARSSLVDQVQSERARDGAEGTTQKVQASITSLNVASRTPARIELRAQLTYSDQRLNATGKVIERTTVTTLPITYVLRRDNEQWRLMAYLRANE